MGREFLKPGKTNAEDRLNFVRFWAKYVRENEDEVWGRQQAVLIDSQVKNAKNFSLTREQYFKIKEAGKKRKR